ncbi:MAG: hypothetical protein QW832_02225 [archaeon]
MAGLLRGRLEKRVEEKHEKRFGKIKRMVEDWGIKLDKMFEAAGELEKARRKIQEKQAELDERVEKRLEKIKQNFNLNALGVFERERLNNAIFEIERLRLLGQENTEGFKKAQEEAKALLEKIRKSTKK